VVSEDPDVVSLIPKLLPEYWTPRPHLESAGQTSKARHHVRVEVRRDGSGGYVVEAGAAITRCPTWSDVPGTLEFVLAQSLIRDSGAAAQVHGAGVSVGGEALLLVGPSGRGKSSLALQLTRLGHPLITDDFLLIHQGGRVEGARRHAKLDAQTLALLGIDPQGTVLWHNDADEAWVDPETLSGWVRHPVGARWIVFLAAERSMDVLQPIPDTYALELLLRSRGPDRSGRSLPVLAELLHAAQAFELNASSHASALSSVLGLIDRRP